MVPEGDALMLTTGTTSGSTVITRGFELATNTVTHGELDVIMQVTTSPLVNVLVANVAELVPAFTPFTCH